ncbi:MAG: hypothetical protein EPO36_13225 [Chloroflexota bacterium]|nr:MAG: hypothetical protein EPO36_13225 [Chloroflexota bacterium]
MLGSTAAELLPTGDSGISGRAVHVLGAPPPDAARREPPAAPPLLRGLGGALVVADRETAWPDLDEPSGVDEPSDLDGPSAKRTGDVDVVAAQLAPIRSHEALASSFAREANPDDPIVRAAYARVWADLALVIARGTTRRARIRAMTTPVRGRRVQP